MCNLSAVTELVALGLLADLDRIGVRTQEVAYFNPQGPKVWAEPRGRFAGYPVPQYSYTEASCKSYSCE
jgi:hypothetical protein